MVRVICFELGLIAAIGVPCTPLHRYCCCLYLLCGVGADVCHCCMLPVWPYATSEGATTCAKRVALVFCCWLWANIPWVEWRGLKSGGGNLIHRKVVFCIFRCQSIWLGISGDNLSSRIFWRNYIFQNEVTWIILRKTHALLRLANAVSPLHSTRGLFCISADVWRGCYCLCYCLCYPRGFCHVLLAICVYDTYSWSVCRVYVRSCLTMCGVIWLCVDLLDYVPLPPDSFLHFGYRTCDSFTSALWQHMAISTPATSW